MLKNKTIICYSGATWNLPWGISQKVMEKLSKFNKVIYIEYQPSLLHCWMHNLSYEKYSNNEDRGVFRKINENLCTYVPRIGMPFNNYLDAINIFNQRGIVRDIKSAIAGYGPTDIILWSFVPYAFYFVNAIGRYLTIYHAAGNYSVEKLNFFRQLAVSRMERNLIDRSDLVIAQTCSLCDKFGSMGKETFYLPSVIDGASYSLAADKEKMDRSELDDIRQPRIGIVGYFDDNFYDIKLLEYLLDAKRDWSFIFIGPVSGKAKRFRGLQKRQNAYFFGYKDPREVPAYIRRFDIGIIPYKVNEFMKDVSPTKFYEYVACGKGVVSTELPDIKKYSDVIKIAQCKEGFLRCMEDILAFGDNLREKAFQVAKENSLDRYLDALSNVIEDMFNEKRA